MWIVITAHTTHPVAATNPTPPAATPDPASGDRRLRVRPAGNRRRRARQPRPLRVGFLGGSSDSVQPDAPAGDPSPPARIAVR
jgi:hypothetical protein